MDEQYLLNNRGLPLPQNIKQVVFLIKVPIFRASIYKYWTTIRQK